MSRYFSQSSSLIGLTLKSMAQPASEMRSLSMRRVVPTRAATSTGARPRYPSSTGRKVFGFDDLEVVEIDERLAHERALRGGDHGVDSPVGG